MRTVIAKLPIAACTVCLTLLGTFAEVARAQTPLTQPGGTTPGMTTPPTPTPGTPSPGTQPGGTTPGTTTPGTGTTPGSAPPGGTTPGSGATGPGQPPSSSAADPFLALLELMYAAVQQFVQEQFPDAPPEFQDWLTGALMDHMFGDMVSRYFFGGSAYGGFGP